MSSAQTEGEAPLNYGLRGERLGRRTANNYGSTVDTSREYVADRDYAARNRSGQ